jgi:hypothetical protein
MATFYESLTDKQIEFIREQQFFCVASAAGTGRINLSPKGMDTFAVLDSKLVAYLDMYGSGNETCAHAQNDGRVTVMFTSFGPKPNILRIYGRVRAVRPQDAEWDRLSPHFETIHGQRQIIAIDVESTQDSCGYAVPKFEFIEHRDTLRKYANKLTQDEYREKILSQTESIDGLPIAHPS